MPKERSLAEIIAAENASILELEDETIIVGSPRWNEVKDVMFPDLE